MSISFKETLRLAVLDGDGQAALRAIAALPDTFAIKPRDLIRSGIEHDGARDSFAGLCLRHLQFKMLEHVVRQAPFGLTLDDFCTFSHLNGGGREHTQSLASLSVAAVRPEGLELAFRLEPTNKSLSALLPYGSANSTLHFIALKRAVIARDVDLTRHLECVRLLKRHGAPIARSTDASSSGAEAFFSNDWHPRHRADIAELLREYHVAGLVNLNVSFHHTVHSVGGLFPLAASIKLGDAAATREIISLGANLELPLTSDAADLHSLVRSHRHTNESELLAAVTEALMARRIRETACGTNTASVTSARHRTVRV
jgi:hypothetical protein